jgi:hypothetical protein
MCINVRPSAFPSRESWDLGKPLPLELGKCGVDPPGPHLVFRTTNRQQDRAVLFPLTAAPNLELRPAFARRYVAVLKPWHCGAHAAHEPANSAGSHLGGARDGLVDASPADTRALVAALGAPRCFGVARKNQQHHSDAGQHKIRTPISRVIDDRRVSTCLSLVL